MRSLLRHMEGADSEQSTSESAIVGEQNSKQLRGSKWFSLEVVLLKGRAQ